MNVHGRRDELEDADAKLGPDKIDGENCEDEVAENCENEVAAEEAEKAEEVDEDEEVEEKEEDE